MELKYILLFLLMGMGFNTFSQEVLKWDVSTEVDGRVLVSTSFNQDNIDLYFSLQSPEGTSFVFLDRSESVVSLKFDRQNMIFQLNGQRLFDCRFNNGDKVGISSTNGVLSLKINGQVLYSPDGRISAPFSLTVKSSKNNIIPTVYLLKP